jgi:putative membrane protein
VFAPLPLAAAGWTFAPGPIALVLAALVVYVVRWRRVRAEPRGHRPGVGRLVLWLLSLLAVLAALVSPIDALADRLLVMHMVQHVLLLDIAPILGLLGLTRVLLRPVTRTARRLERQAGFLAHPVFAACFYVGVMWAWHIPALYDAALSHPAIHAFEHLVFSAAGGLYWWHLLSPIRSRQRLNGLAPVVYMVATKLGVGFLGVVLTFAPHALYPHYAHGPRDWGLTADQDQSLAGLVMALEQSLVMGVALAWLFARMLGESEREAERAERYEAV